MFATDIDPKALESLFDLDPSLENSFDLTEYVAGVATSFTEGLLAGSTPCVPDSAVVTTPVADSLVTLTSASAGQHLADFERQTPNAANVNSTLLLQQTSPGPVVPTAVSPVQQNFQQPVLSPSLTVDEVSQALSDDSCVFMPEFETLAASTAATTTSQGGQWGQGPFYSTVKTEDLTLCSLTACSAEANLPGFTSTTTSSSPVCKTEYMGEGSLTDSPYGRSSHGRTLSESSCSTATSSVPDTPRRSSKGGSRRRQVPKGSEEYKEKRARNNVAVRKSRAKAKEKQRMTEVRVKELVDLNDSLQKKVEMLTKELTVLKGLFVNVGASLPEDFAKIMEQS